VRGTGGWQKVGSGTMTINNWDYANTGPTTLAAQAR
jgi:hypothetical protein